MKEMKSLKQKLTFCMYLQWWLRSSRTDFLSGMLGMAPLTCTHREAAAAVVVKSHILVRHIFHREKSKKIHGKIHSATHTSKSEAFLFGLALHQGHSKSSSESITSSSCINDCFSKNGRLLNWFFSIYEKGRSFGTKFHENLLNTLKFQNFLIKKTPEK